jgi:hypothetical protein
VGGKEAKNGSKMHETMINPCYYCLCDSCINNVENTRVKPTDVYCGWKPCFQCDDCRVYDGDISKRSMEVASCERYAIDNYHAARNRKKFKLVEEEKA